MNSNQKGFLAAITLMLLLMVVLPILYLIGGFAIAEYGRPSVSKIAALEGQPISAVLAELKALEFGCSKVNEQSNIETWTCGADEATIAGLCFWRIRISAAADGKAAKPETLKADGQCKK